MGKLLYLKNVVTLRLDREICTDCGICMVVCPREVFSEVSGTVKISDLDACIECGACSLNCPVCAITVRAGVGCAAAIIREKMGGDADGCCCAVEKEC